MTNPLAPTTITDKNGRITTVHKRMDSDSAKKTTTMPAPALSPSPASTARTPLKTPAPLTKEQSKELFEWRKKMLENSHYNDNAKKAAMGPMDPVSESLAWRLLQGRVAPEALISSLIEDHQIKHYMWKRTTGGVNPSRLHMKLRVTERMAENNATILNYEKSSSTIKMAIDGYCYSPKKEERVLLESVDSEEELAQLTAVATFIRHADYKGHNEQFKDAEFVDSEGQGVRGMWMTNKLLQSYLKENPHELNRVLEYMETRELGTKVKETRDMIQHLAESADLGVMDNGWL